MSFGTRALLILGLFLAWTVRLTADDHIRTGGQYQEPYPYMTPGSVIRTDQRFHPGDPTPACARIYMSCHAGDVIINPVATVTRIELTIPAGVNLNWNTGLTPSISWPGTNSPANPTQRVNFTSYPTTKICRFTVSSSFTPISDNFDVNGLGFQTVGLGLSTPSGPGNLVDNVIENATGSPSVFPHFDDATIRVSEYCTASTFGGDPLNQIISPGTTVTMDDIVITESSTAGNGGIWQTGPGAVFDNGIRITIPAGMGVTFNPVQGITCVGSAVAAGHILANPTVNYSEDGGRTVRIPVSSDFGTSNSVRIQNLQLTTTGGASDQTFSLDIRTGARTNLNDLTVPGSSRPGKQIVGLPTISSTALTQTYTVGDPSIVGSPITIVDSPGTPKITDTDGIRIIIPNSLNMTFDTSVGTVGCVGSAVPGHMPASTNGVTYTGGAGNNKIAIIPVASPFGAGNSVTISGLKYMNFSNNSGSVGLQLECVSSRAGIEATDNHPIAIGKPTISSSADQVFFVAPPLQAMNTLTITDDATHPRIGTSPGRVSQLRIVIPLSFNMTWQGSSPASVTGSLLTGVSYPTTRTLLLTASADFPPGGTATVTGLNFNIASASVPDNLELFMSGGVGATPTSLDDKIIAIGGIPTMTSTTNQEFTVNDPTTLGNAILLTDATSPSFQMGNTLQVVIPAGLNMTYNTAFIPAAVPGGGAGTVGARSFPNDRTLNIPVTADFTGSQTLTISGIRFTNFLAPSGPVPGPQPLQLRVSIGGPIAATDNRTKAIGVPTMTSAAAQVFGSTDLSTQAANILITDDGTTPRIKTGTDIRVRIPAGFLMQWDPGVLPTLTVGGPGVGAVGVPSFNSPTNDILLIPVSTSFSAGRTLTISGARFRNFGLSATDNLELEVNNTGSAIPNAFDTQTIKVGTRPTISSIATRDFSGNGSIDTLLLTFSENINPAGTSVSAGVGFSVTGYTIATGNVVGNTLAFGLIETGTPDTGATPVVSYDPIAGNLVDQNDGLKLTQTTLVATADGARPTIVSFGTADLDSNGRIDQVTFSFSEILLAGQEDIGDWTLIDADGQTNLLAGLTNANVSISGNYVIITLANTTGTLGTPRYRYQSNGIGGILQDAAANLTLTLTNNSAPVAIAGPDQSVSPQLVTLDASASFDPDFQPVTYSWNQTAGPVNPVGLSSLNTARTTFFTVIPGVYTFRVDVSDGLLTTSDIVNVTILNIAPTAFVVANQVANAGDFVIFLGDLSSDINGNSDITTFTWAQTAGPVVVLDTSFPPEPSFTPTLPGLYEFELTLADTAANSSKTRVRVRVHDPAAAPNPLAVPTADAGPDQTRSNGSLVTLDGRLSSIPIAGRSLSYAWSGPVALTNANTATPSFTPTIPGLYTFGLVVTDTIAGGLSSFEDTVSILVFNPANKPPSASAAKLSPSGTPVVGDLITLDSTGSQDPEGAPLQYAWFQVSGPAAILSRYNAAQATFTAVTSGTYEFMLIVTDGIQQSPPVTTKFQVVTSSVILPTTITATLTNPVLGNGHVDIATSPLTLTSTGLSGSETHEFWEQISGPGVRMSSAGPFPPAFWFGPTITFTPPVPGRYVFKVNALRYPDLLLSDSTIEVIVDDLVGNAAPSANAGADQPSATAKQLVALNGSGSSADAATYYWAQLAGPPVEFSDPFATNPTFTPPAAGVYVFSLVVNDGTASSASDSVVVTVGPAAATPVVKGSSGGCGLSFEPLLLLGVLTAWRRRRRR